MMFFFGNPGNGWCGHGKSWKFSKSCLVVADGGTLSLQSWPI